MKRLIGPLLVAIVLLSALPVAAQADAQGATCDGRQVTIDLSTNGGNGNGTSGPDVILGTSGADTINGFGGNDTICAGGGNDMVQGGIGDDVIFGGGGSDKLFGAQGADIIHGGNGSDTIHGNLGNDRLYGEGGPDKIYGYADDDLIEGGGGNDRLHGNFGNDTINGGPDDDDIFGYGDDDTLNGGPGADLIGGNFGNDTINGDGGNDNMYGSDGSDTLTGGDGNDLIQGNSGPDTLRGNAGNDTLDGGIGFDRCRGDGGTNTATRCETTDVTAPAPTPASSTPTPSTTPTSTPVSGTNPPSEPIPEPGTNFTVAFEEDFRLESSLNRFNWALHTGAGNNGTPDTWPGDHDLNCGPPSTSRTIHKPDSSDLTDVGETAYWCDPAPGKEHMMTSMNTRGYEHIDFSPAQTFDSVSRVCWDQNMNNLGRKWTQVAVISEASFQADNGRLDYVKPQFEGGPGDGGVFLSRDDFLFTMSGGGTEINTGRSGSDVNFRGFTTSDKRRRFTTCLEDLEDGRIRIELERESTIEVRVLNGAMPEGPVRVIFQDVTYNATKNNNGSSDPNTSVPNPFTWHWDNISVETR